MLRSATGRSRSDQTIGRVGILYYLQPCYCFIPLAFADIPCYKREMNNTKWTWFAILYQCGFAYAIALMINQFGGAFTGNVNPIGLVFAIAVLGVMIYMLFVKKYKESTILALLSEIPEHILQTLHTTT